MRLGDAFATWHAEHRRWVRHRSFPLLLLNALFTGLFSLLIAAGRLQPTLQSWIPIPIDLCAVVMAFWAARAQGTGRAQPGWRWMAAAYGSLLLADILWVLHQLLPDLAWLQPSSLLGYTVLYPLLVMGLLQFARPSLKRASLTSYVLDALILVLAAGMFGWQLIIGPAVFTHPDPFVRLLSLAHVLDILLIGGLIALLPFQNRGMRVSMYLLSAGLLLYSVADLMFIALDLQDSATMHIMWLTGKFFMAFSAQYHLYRSGAVAEGGEEAPVDRNGTSLLAVLAVAASFALLYVATDPSGPSRTLFRGTLVVTALFVIRQVRVIREISSLRAKEITSREQARAERRFKSLVQYASDVVTIIDRHGIIQYESEALRRLFGYSAVEVYGTYFGEYLHPADRPLLKELLLAVAEVPGQPLVREWRIWHREGGWRYSETIAVDLTADESVAGIVFNTRDISERKALEQRLTHQAEHDALTGLANRAKFRSYLELVLSEPTCHPVTVMFLDLDGFKAVNDTHGHFAGDIVLVEAADRIRASAHGGLVARLGGDEFAVALVSTDAVAGAAIGRQIVQALSQPILVGGQERYISVSIGLADSGHTADAEVLLRRADTAMYRAKSAGKGRVEVYRPGLDTHSRTVLEWESEIRQALLANQFVLHYQPTVQLRSGMLVGFEALIRWQHPERGLLPPGDFVPLAEASGLIIPIGRWVLAEACRQAKWWTDRYPEKAPRSLGVNIAASQLAEPDIVSQVAAILAETQLPPQMLILEITESMLADDPSGVIRDRLVGLKELGVRLAIDDFGTGYSSLSYVKHFPIDVVKIDRSFVAGVATGTKDQALMRSIVELAKALELHTVAEGIEEREQAEILTQLQCHTGQGYYFSRPMPPEAVESLLLAQPGTAERALLPLAR